MLPAPPIKADGGKAAFEDRRFQPDQSLVCVNAAF